MGSVGEVDTTVDPNSVLSSVKCLVFVETLENDCRHPSQPLTNYLAEAMSRFGVGNRGPFTTYQVVNADMTNPYVIIGHGVRFLRNTWTWGTSEISIRHMAKKPNLGVCEFENHQELKSRFPFLEVSAEMETTGRLFFVEMEVPCDAIRTAVDEKSRQEIVSRTIECRGDNDIDGEMAITKTLGTLQSNSSVRITVVTNQHLNHMMQMSSILRSNYHRRFRSRLDGLSLLSLGSRVFRTGSVLDWSEWPFKPDQPKVQFWASLEHRTATLGIGEMCEQTAHFDAHDELRKKKVRVIPFLIPDMVDKESGYPTAFLLVVDKASHIRPELLPRCYERCKVAMGYIPPTPDPPDPTSDEYPSEEAFIHLVSNHIFKAWREAAEMSFNISEEMAMVTASLLEVAKDHSDDTVMKWVDSTRRQSNNGEFGPAGESVTAWVRRISQFVQAEKDNLKLPVPEMETRDWHAYAIPVPENLAGLTHCVLFAYVPSFSIRGPYGIYRRAYCDYRKMRYIDARKDSMPPNTPVPRAVLQDVCLDIEDHSETTESRIWAINKIGDVQNHPRVAEWLLQSHGKTGMHNFAKSFPAAGELANHLEQRTIPTNPNLRYLYNRM